MKKRNLEILKLYYMKLYLINKSNEMKKENEIERSEQKGRQKVLVLKRKFHGRYLDVC